MAAIQQKKDNDGSGDHRKSHLLRLAVWLAVLLPVVRFLFWEVTYETEYGGVFSPLMLFEWALWMLWFILLVASPVWAVVRWKTSGWRSILAVLVLLLAVPMCGFATTLWLEYNLRTYAAERTRLFQRVQTTERLSTEPSWLGEMLINEPAAQLSIDRKIRVKRAPKGTFVLFATWYGMPDGFSGFVYGPDGADPRTGWPELRLDWSDPWRDGGNVYFVGNF